jgi:hypothetical protein
MIVRTVNHRSPLFYGRHLIHVQTKQVKKISESLLSLFFLKKKKRFFTSTFNEKKIPLLK